MIEFIKSIDQKLIKTPGIGIIFSLVLFFLFIVALFSMPDQKEIVPIKEIIGITAMILILLSPLTQTYAIILSIKQIKNKKYFLPIIGILLNIAGLVISSFVVLIFLLTLE